MSHVPLTAANIPTKALIPHSRRMKILPSQRLHNTLLPNRCIICGARLEPCETVVCAVCNIHLPRTGHSLTPGNNDMVRMFWGQITPERAIAYLHHYPHSESGTLIYAIKYGGDKATATALGRMMADECGRDGFFNGIDVIVPVPLSRDRERQRGYNQSLLIAKGISSSAGIAVGGNVMERTAFAQAQTELYRQKRHDNVAGVFRLTDAATIRGRHVLIVDDVVTTGATMTACGKAIMEAGAARVSFMAVGMSSS